MEMPLATLGIGEVMLHHDLLIELGRIEMALERMQSDVDRFDQDDQTMVQLQLLEGRRIKLNAMLARLSV